MDAAPKGPPISSVKPKAKTTVRLGDQPCSSRCSTAAREPIREFLVSLAPRPQTISPSKTGKTQTVESQQDCSLEDRREGGGGLTAFKRRVSPPVERGDGRDDVLRKSVAFNGTSSV